jgi:cyclin H
MKVALFFALKTDNYYLDLDKYLVTLPGTTRSDILDYEYLLLRTLRYTMDVRHPFRGLEGGVMELMAVANGAGEAPPGSALSAAELRRDLQAIEPLTAENAKPVKETHMPTRISNAANKAKNLLKTAAVLTDAYFLYTPSQIWLAALYTSDAPLTTFYLSTKFPAATSQPLLLKILKTIQSCATLLQSYHPTTEAEVKSSLKSIGKRLHYIEKLWEKFPRQGVKRNEEDDEEELEKANKKRKLEREKGEREGEVFGPALETTKGGGGGTGGGGDWSD